jgi:hypothetical protein
MDDLYPFNMFKSKLYHWNTKRTLDTIANMIVLPKTILDEYIKTFKAVYRP